MIPLQSNKVGRLKKTAQKIYFTAIFEHITQLALRYLGFYQVGKGAS